jgi:hypothetical protein
LVAETVSHRYPPSHAGKKGGLEDKVSSWQKHGDILSENHSRMKKVPISFFFDKVGPEE